MLLYFLLQKVDHARSQQFLKMQIHLVLDNQINFLQLLLSVRLFVVQQLHFLKLITILLINYTQTHPIYTSNIIIDPKMINHLFPIISLWLRQIITVYNLNSNMKSLQKQQAFFELSQQKNHLANIGKWMQHHSDPNPKCFIPPQRTESDEGLYQFALFDQNNSLKPYGDKERSEDKKNVELTLALVSQNDEIVNKIKQIKQLVSSEQLKAAIFKKKYEENQKTIAELRNKKASISNESAKLKTLNESTIPNKSVELNTTHNTNAWLNQLLNKSQLQHLWSKQKQKDGNNHQAKTKSYTIDLSTFMKSARLNSQKVTQKCKLNESKGLQQKTKAKGANKILSTRPMSYKQRDKAQLLQKQRLLNKNLSQLRSMKKTKCNPQL